MAVGASADFSKPAPLASSTAQSGAVDESLTLECEDATANYLKLSGLSSTPPKGFHASDIRESAGRVGTPTTGASLVVPFDTTKRVKGQMHKYLTP